MIISDEYKYVFVQIPHTASTAIAEELQRYYGGRSILRKHSYLPEFERHALPRQRDYFVFGAIRNPLDERVSIYHKLKSDHLGLYSDTRNHRGPGRWINGMAKRRFEFVRQSGTTFEDYFRRYCGYTYDNPISLRKDRYDRVLYYEDISNGFEEILGMLGIAPVRPLPLSNPTGGKEVQYSAYYTAGIIPKAVRVFGPFMEEWGYNFPEEWGERTVPASSRLGYWFWGAARRAYWRGLWRFL